MWPSWVSREINTHVHPQICTQMTALLIIIRRMETTQKSINVWMNKKTVWHSHTRIPLSNNNEWAIDSYSSMEESQRHCAEWKKLFSNSYRLYDSTYVTSWKKKKANRVLPREHTVIAKTLFQKRKRQWTSAGGQYQNQIDYIPCSLRWRSSIQSAKTRPGVDCGSDHELLIAKFRLKLKKVGKTTRPFRYDLNQIP